MSFIFLLTELEMSFLPSSFLVLAISQLIQNQQYSFFEFH
jgi:hypothetical protein